MKNIIRARVLYYMVWAIGANQVVTGLMRADWYRCIWYCDW